MKLEKLISVDTIAPGDALTREELLSIKGGVVPCNTYTHPPLYDEDASRDLDDD